MPNRKRSAATGRDCRSCGAALPWTRIHGREATLWFAVCSCGIPAAFLPLRPEHEPEDPLVAAFGPPSAPTRPPWIRVFQLTSGYPWWLPWRHVPGGCARCRQDVTFAVWTRPRPDRWAHSTLCLACGRATSEYVGASDHGMSEAPLSGSEWSPPCVAVARLRRAVFSLPWAGWNRGRTCRRVSLRIATPTATAHDPGPASVVATLRARGCRARRSCAGPPARQAVSRGPGASSA